MLGFKKRKKVNVQDLDLQETVVHINRISKVVKGGKRFKFSSIVVVGDMNGYVGVGHGKGQEIADAIKKASENARKNVTKVNVIDGTIPYEIVGKCSASKILMKPASKGTGIIATGKIRPVLEYAGIKDILTKSLGSNTAINLVYATLDGLLKLKSPDEIMKLRGVKQEKTPNKKSTKS
ncbi:MAG: 30S ribosomal protein S5 [Candidatus Cloacimonas sp. 4484_209]|nr:MAG: 30S ribosomal protein S5 [Candidatus Cloacimonas sp. 4484_209]